MVLLFVDDGAGVAVVVEEDVFVLVCCVEVVEDGVVGWPVVDVGVLPPSLKQQQIKKKKKNKHKQSLSVS